MSALSSPAASPRDPFSHQHHHHRSHRHSSPRAHQFGPPHHRSPTSASRHPPSTSPRRAFNAPATPSSSHPNKQLHLERGLALAETPSYVSCGTQYSPDGLPPTAFKVANAVGKPPGLATDSNQTGSGGARKRKEAATSSSASSSPEPMSSTSASSGAIQRSAQQPDEPIVRHDPARLAGSTNADSSEPELQEARSTHGHSAAPKRSRAEPGSMKVMPLKYEDCNPKDLGVLIANMLMELIRINDRIPLRDGRLTRFHSRAPPGISVTDYLQRLIQHATLSPPIMLSMVYYIDRLCTLYPAFTINSLTVHRFLITAATVAAKGLSDSFWTNPTYARIGGIPVSELATLELDLLQRTEWRIVPRPEVLEEYYASLVDRTDGFVMEVGPSSESDSSSVVDGETAVGPSKDGKDDQQMADEPT